MQGTLTFICSLMSINYLTRNPARDEERILLVDSFRLAKCRGVLLHPSFPFHITPRDVVSFQCNFRGAPCRRYASCSSSLWLWSAFGRIFQPLCNTHTLTQTQTQRSGKLHLWEVFFMRRGTRRISNSLLRRGESGPCLIKFEIFTVVSGLDFTMVR